MNNLATPVDSQPLTWILIMADSFNLEFSSVEPLFEQKMCVGNPIITDVETSMSLSHKVNYSRTALN